MIVQALDGRSIAVRRRWVPWRLRARKFDGFDAFNIVGGADDPVSFVVLIVVAILLALFGGIILTVVILAGELLLLLALLLPLLAAARMLYVLPWTIEATYGDQVLGTVGVRGWSDSEERIREIAASYQHGGDPFAAARDASAG